MNSLYKRFVTMCMISVSCVLAWVYCLLEFKDKPAVIMSVSILLVASIYTLFWASYKIRLEKDKNIDNYIKTTLEGLTNGTSKNDNTELERITKALYVQLQKSNSTLSQLYKSSLDMENDRILALTRLRDELSKIISSIDELAAAEDTNTPDYDNLSKVSTEQDDSSFDTAFDAYPEQDDSSFDTAFDTYPEQAGDSLDTFSENYDSIPESYTEAAPDEDLARLTNDFFNQFGAAKNDTADIIQFPGKGKNEPAGHDDITNSIVDNASQDQQI